MAKRKFTLLHTMIISLVSLFILFLCLYYLYNRYYITPGKHYPGFGIRIPENYQIHGIDVSRYQGNISWEMVKEMNSNNKKIAFAFMKATEGTNLVDTRFGMNWSQSHKAGITRGAYHFFNAGQSPQKQATNFIQRVSLSKGDLPPVLDVEQTNGLNNQTFQKEVREWLRIIEQHYGVKPIIYTYTNFYDDYLIEGFDEYPFWIAHYNGSNAPRSSRQWHFWQHNEKGQVNGINSFVDFNVFNGDSTAFYNLCIQ